MFHFLSLGMEEAFISHMHLLLAIFYDNSSGPLLPGIFPHAPNPEITSDMQL